MMASELLKFENWVVVGDVLNETKYANKILKVLKDNGFNVSGVNPRINDDTVYKNLKQVPYKIDVIDLCINPINGMEIVKEASQLKINKILIQPGAGSESILKYCEQQGITAIEGCALIEVRNRI